MAVVAKRLGKGNMSSTETVVYTVPTGTKTLVKAVTLCNMGSVNVAVTMNIAGAAVIFAHVIKPNDTITIPFMDQVMEAGETITLKNTPSVGSYYISGKEVT